MSDIIERAEAAVAPGNLANVDPPLIEVDPDLLRDLIDALKAARKQARYFELTIKEEISSLTPAEVDEIRSLAPEVEIR